MVHILTDKDLLNPENDGFSQRLEGMFGRVIVRRSLSEGRYILLRNYLGVDEEKPARVFQGIHIFYHTFPPGQISLSVLSEIPERFKNTKMVLVNMTNADLGDVSIAYPNALVAGYADSDEEEERLKSGKLDGTLVLRPQPEKNRGVMRFVYSDVHFLGQKLDLNNPLYGGRVLRAENIDELLAEYLRLKILEDRGPCIGCTNIRRYKYAERYFLNHKSVEELFQYSPINGCVSVSEYPVMGNIGAICGRWDPFTQMGWGSGICRDGSSNVSSSNVSQNAAREFIDAYGLLLERVGIDVKKYKVE